MALTLDLTKAKMSLKLSLEKKGIITPPTLDLAFILDVSGSFDQTHTDGLTNDILVRMVPWGMLFDPDGKIDVFTFSAGAEHAHYVGEVVPENCDGYVQRKIIRKVPGYNGGTDYSYVLEKALQHFGWAPQPTPKVGFFKKLLKRDKPTEARKSLCIMVTDGECYDDPRTRKILEASKNRNDRVYFLFLGVNENQRKFNFIKELGTVYPNVGFTPVEDVSEWVKKTDEQLNESLIEQELVDWMKQ